jgi:putative methyltransferase (TIGR04325 family)
VNSQSREQVPARIWEGVHATWQDACAAAQAVGGVGLGGDTWFQRITQQLADYRQELRDRGVAMPPRPSNLPVVCALTTPRTIVDFGGSSGWCWDYLRESWPGHTVTSYIVVETREVVEYMKHAALQATPVSYQTGEEPLGATDLLYCNSVLQYFGANDAFLSLVARAAPQYILLDDLVAGADKDFFTIQLFRGSAIPYRFLGLQTLLDHLAEHGYLELARYPYASPVKGVVAPMAMENFPPARQLRYSSSVLLKRSVRK